MSTYDVLMEVETETLTEDAYKVDEFAGNVTLLVEAQVRFPVTHDLKRQTAITRQLIQGGSCVLQRLGRAFCLCSPSCVHGQEDFCRSGCSMQKRINQSCTRLPAPHSCMRKDSRTADKHWS